VRDALETWVNDADALQYIDKFALETTPTDLAYLRGREDDYYISLVGELFGRLHEPYEDPLEWSRLGNALTQTGLDDLRGAATPGSAALPRDTALFAASAFYFGGFAASAYLTLKAGQLRRRERRTPRSLRASRATGGHRVGTRAGRRRCSSSRRSGSDR
jgi:ATP-dependent DNA helicase